MTDSLRKNVMNKAEKKGKKLVAGAAASNITPLEPHFLFGYPFVERISEGVNDWLLSSALYLADGNRQVLLVSNDVIFVSKASVSRILRLEILSSAKYFFPSSIITGSISIPVIFAVGQI